MPKTDISAAIVFDLKKIFEIVMLKNIENVELKYLTMADYQALKEAMIEAYLAGAASIVESGSHEYPSKKEARDWYDNEYGYSHQVIRLAKYIAKVRRYTYY